MQLTGNAFLKFYAIAGNLAQIVVWGVWLWLCFRVLDLEQINPAAAGTEGRVLWLAAGIGSGLMLCDVIRVWRADPKHRRLWLTVLLRAAGVFLFLWRVWWLFAPALHQLLELE